MKYIFYDSTIECVFCYDRFIHLLSYIENAEEVGHTGCNGNYYWFENTHFHIDR